jgi:hypothetical protein
MNTTNYEIESVPPCRIYRPGPDGVPMLVEVITERQRVNLDFRRTDIEATQGAYLLHRDSNKGRASMNPPKLRSLRDRAPVSGPSMEAVMDGLRRGLTRQQIASALGCHETTVGDHMRKWRKTSPEFVALEGTLRCARCGGRKRRKGATCSFCVSEGHMKGDARP